MPSAKEDYFEGGLPVHKTSYCAFLDVLGFSERIRASEAKGEANKTLQEFHAIFSKRLKKLKEEHDESLQYFKSFSDNILLAHPQFSQDMESEFGFILDSICQYQLDMSIRGYFIRGGLAVGALFMDENSVYGQALLDAYRLETQVAVNPRLQSTQAATLC
ncbi:MAG: hypothetical protein ING75_05560 [Rhodocyclaceae bacterium]|nr:hypothetical protein [Rhodocyclaceae bacterium]